MLTQVGRLERRPPHVASHGVSPAMAARDGMAGFAAAHKLLTGE